MVQPRHAASFYPQCSEEKAAPNKAAVSANPPDLPVFLPQTCRRARKNYVSSVSSAEGAIMISTQCPNAYGYDTGRKASKHILQDIHQMKRV